jgi:plasmid stability protein
MPSVQIKNVPDHVHAVMRQRAADAGQSLQEYLLALLVAEAEQETNAALFERIGRLSGGSAPLSWAVERVRADRDSR